MGVADEIAQLLRCPDDRGALQDDSAGLTCSVCGAGYPLVGQYVDFRPTSESDLEGELQQYYEQPDYPFDPRVYPWKVENLLAVLGDRRPAVILDAGCGTAHVLRQVGAVLGAQALIGVEWSAAILRAAEPPTADDIPCALLRASVNRLPLADDSVDLAMAVDIVEHLPEPQMMLEQLRRVSRALVAKIPLGGRLRPWRRNFGHLHSFNLTQCRQMMAGTGWRIAAESFPAQPVLPKPDKGSLYNALYTRRRHLNQTLRRLMNRPRWYLAYAERA